MKCLVEGGANLNQGMTDGRTPLFMAACEGHLEVVKCLVGGGADMELKWNNKETPLDAAKRTGHAQIVGYLRSKGGK